MQFQVPQFIESEARIVGPLSLKQFLYLAAGAAVLFITFFIFAFPLWIVMATVVTSIAGSLAFLKVNGRPFPLLFRYAAGYFLKPRIYLWQQPGAAPAGKPEARPKEQSRLRTLFFSLLTTTKPIAEREKSSRPFHLFGSGESPLRWQMLRHTTGERDAARRVDYR